MAVKDRLMQEKIDKARKMMSVWAVDADRLTYLSDQTGMTKVELFHEAIRLLEEKRHYEQGNLHIG